MTNANLFAKYAAVLSRPNFTSATGGPLPAELLIESSGALSVYYAPFDHVNHDAKVVLVGITPGMTQARLALDSAAASLNRGETPERALSEAKVHASFGGAMRNNLVQILDYLGLASSLGVATTMDLFSKDSTLAHFTSVLRYPVFVNGKNYSGNPDPIKEDILMRHLAFFEAEVEALSHCLFIPLGKLPNLVLKRLSREGVVQAKNILFDIPHPSGANQERINYFLDRKERSNLSSRTNPELLDNVKRIIVGKLESFSLV
jgi:hypothetical protein